MSINQYWKSNFTISFICNLNHTPVATSLSIRIEIAHLVNLIKTPLPAREHCLFCFSGAATIHMMTCPILYSANPRMSVSHLQSVHSLCRHPVLVCAHSFGKVLTNWWCITVWVCVWIVFASYSGAMCPASGSQLCKHTHTHRMQRKCMPPSHHYLPFCVNRTLSDMTPTPKTHPPKH